MQKNVAQNNNHVKPFKPYLPNRYRYFLNLKQDFHHWNINSPVFLANRTISKSETVQIIENIGKYDNGLRLQYYIDQKGQYSESIQAYVNPFVDEIKIDSKNCLESIKEYINNAQNSLFGANKALIAVLLFHNNNQTYFTVICHHLLTDGLSFKALLKTIVQCIDNPNDLPIASENIQFSEYTKLYLNYCNKNKEKELAYWNYYQNLPSVNPFNTLPSNPKNTNSNAIDITLELAHIESSKKVFTHNGKKFSFVDILYYSIFLSIQKVFSIENIAIDTVFNNRALFSGQLLNKDLPIGWLSDTAPVTITGNNNDIANIHQQLLHHSIKGKAFNFLSQNDIHQPRFPVISFNSKFYQVKNKNFYKTLKVVSPPVNSNCISSTSQRVYLLSGGTFVKNDIINISWDFCPELISKSTIERMVKIQTDTIQSFLKD